MRAYALKAGQGWTYHAGVDFTVKAGELGAGRNVAVLEYATRRGEEPPEHTHGTEDEIFYVLEGALIFRCGGQTFDVGQGGFVFLPSGVEHGYTIGSDAEVRLLVVTSPAGVGEVPAGAASSPTSRLRASRGPSRQGPDRPRARRTGG